MITRELCVDYWEMLNSLDVVTIVAVTPRPGTDFLHSLLDGHPQILTFDGWLNYHKYYFQSISLFGTKNKFLSGNNHVLREVNISHFFYEFAWHHLHKFDSRYDDLEMKGNLGLLYDEYNEINIDLFVKYATCLMEGKSFSAKNSLLATYAAYALAKGEDIYCKKVLLHNVHLPENLDLLLNDYPDVKIISCIRDPRDIPTKIKTSNMKMELSRYSIGMTSALFTLGVEGYNRLEGCKNVKTNALERLHSNPREVMVNICSWLDIKYQDILLQSTWNGKKWNGDALSTDIKCIFDVSRYSESQRKWNRDMTFYDKLVIEKLMSDRVFKGVHINKSRSLLRILIPLLVLLPTKYEVDIFLEIISKKKIILIYSLMHIILFRYYKSYKLLWNKRSMNKFETSLL